MRPDGEPVPTDGARLCGACGMCCDGTLFDHVDIAPENATELAAAGVRVEIGRSRLPQPCSAHRPSSGADGACTVYDIRPQPCRSFRCLALRRVGAGELPLEDALAQVAEARSRERALLATLRACTDGGGSDAATVRSLYGDLAGGVHGDAVDAADRGAAERNRARLMYAAHWRWMAEHFHSYEQADTDIE